MLTRRTLIACAGRAIMIGVSALSIGCGSDPDEPPDPPTVTQVAHLVIDSGSSGTRFCLFTVERSNEEAPSKRCAVGDSLPTCGKGDGGLAAMTNGKPPSEVPATVTPNLEEAWSKLSDAIKDAGGDTAVLNEISYAAALGTGGYRDPATAAPAQNPAWDAVWETIRQFLMGKGVENVVAEAILGEDEGKLAWTGVAEATAPTEEFAIIETGGATLQLAAGAPEDDYEALKATAVYRGQTYEFEELKSDPAFTVCYSPMDKAMQDADACINLITEKVFSDGDLSALAAGVTPRLLYGLGAPWSSIFREYPNAPPWPPKTSKDLNPAISLTNLQALAEKVCPLSDEEIKMFAPNSYDVSTMSGKACYALSFHAAYFGALAKASKSGEIMPGGDDQWARGAHE